MRRVSATEEARRRLIYSNSTSDSDAAKRAGIPYHTWTCWRTSRGLKRKLIPSRDLSKPPIFQSKQILLIWKMRQKGFTWKQVGKRLKLEDETCYRKLKLAYIPDIETAPACIPWEIAIQGMSPRTISLLDKYGSCVEERT